MSISEDSEVSIMSSSSSKLTKEAVRSELAKRKNSLSGLRPFSEYNNGLLTLTRKQALMIWIKETCEPWLRRKFQDANLTGIYNSPNFDQKKSSIVIDDINQRTRHYSAIFAALVLGQFELAVNLSLHCNMPNLSSLMSMASSGTGIIRSLAQIQIQEWKNHNIIQHIPRILLKIYSLFAGQYEVILSDQDRIYVLEGLPWLVCLSCFIVFFSPYSASLEDCLNHYDSIWPCSNKKVAAPIPPNIIKPYQDDVSEYFDEDILTGFDWPRDMIYNLMHLSVNPLHKQSTTLDPLGFCQSNCSLVKMTHQDCIALNGYHPMYDWSASWHIWRVLTSLIGSCSMPQVNEDLMNKLTEEYSDQLLASGLWEWSIFVISYKRDPVERTRLIEGTIQRAATLTESKSTTKISFANDCPWTNTEDFVINRLNIPKKWLHYSRALLAHSLLISSRHVPKSYKATSYQSTVLPIQPLNKTGKNLACLAISHYLESKNFQEAHDLAITWILPDLLLASNPKVMPKKKLVKLILDLLEPFANLPLSQTPCNFDTGVGIYLAFSAILDLTLNLDQILSYNNENQNIEEEYELKEKTSIRMLRAELTKICDRLQMMPINNLKSNIVKCEMTLLSSRLLLSHIESTFELYEDRKIIHDNFMKEERVELVNQLQEILTLMTEIGLPSDMQDAHLKYLYSIKTNRLCS